MKSVALAIFVKTPGLSPIKTRLAKEIGESTALAVYEACLQSIEKRVRSFEEVLGVDIFWAVAEERGLGDRRWSAFQRIYQGEGDLGDRLGHVYKELKVNYKIVICMGSDSPLFPLSDVIAGVQSLGHGQYASFLGRTQDGGYYVFGSQENLPLQVWKDIRYSTSNTADDFEKKLKPYGNLLQLPVHWDIDTAQDLKFFLEQLQLLMK